MGNGACMHRIVAFPFFSLLSIFVCDHLSTLFSLIAGGGLTREWRPLTVPKFTELQQLSSMLSLILCELWADWRVSKLYRGIRCIFHGTLDIVMGY